MNRDQRKVTTWLFIGVIMVFVQILLGGITRLTGSGLSITKWDIVTGTIPPLNRQEWENAFEAYQATPQYRQINEGMSLSRFKFIFFWEYIHRVWARSMGFVFLFPFLIFLARGSLSRPTLWRLALVIGIATLAAVFGWIMVASGLVSRPWVNAYKLTIHLSLGISLFISLFYAWIKEKGTIPIRIKPVFKNMLKLLLVITIFQVMLGGMMSGMKASLFYPTWPDMRGVFLPAILFDPNHWTMDNFLMYDKSGFMPTLVQVLHRCTAYIIFTFSLGLLMLWILKKSLSDIWIPMLLLGIIVVQMLLGILTLLGSIGSIPVLFGAMHQGMGIMLITVLFYFSIFTKRP